MKLPLVFPLSLSPPSSLQAVRYVLFPVYQKRGRREGKLFRKIFPFWKSSVRFRSIVAVKQVATYCLSKMPHRIDRRKGRRGGRKRDEEERQLGGKLFSPARQRARRKTEILSPAPLFPLGQKGKIISRPHYLVWGICSSRCSLREKEVAFLP